MSEDRWPSVLSRARSSAKFERIRWALRRWRYFPSRWRYVLDSNWESLGWVGAWTLVEDYEEGRDVDMHRVWHYRHKDTGEDQYIYHSRSHRQFTKEKRFEDSTPYGAPAESFKQRGVFGGTSTYAPLEDRLTHEL